MTEAVLQQGAVPAASDKPTLKDLVQDFISMALIVRRGRQVTSVQAFEGSVERFFANLERDARAANYSVEQVKDLVRRLNVGQTYRDFLSEHLTTSEAATLRKHTSAMSFDEIYSPGYQPDISQQAKLLEDYRNQIFGSGLPQAGPGDPAPGAAAAGTCSLADQAGQCGQAQPHLR